MPEKGPRPEQLGVTPERAESKKIALEKLEELKSPQTNFAIRFVHPDEYKEILDTGMLSAYEVIVLKKKEGGEQVSFEEFLTQSIDRGWGSTAEDLTDWPSSVRNIRDYEELMSLLRDAHQEAKKSGVKDLGERTLRIFRESIIKIVEATPLTAATTDAFSFKLLFENVQILKKLEACKQDLTEYLSRKEIDKVVETVEAKIKGIPDRSLEQGIQEALKTELRGKVNEEVLTSYEVSHLSGSLSLYHLIGKDRLETANQFLSNPDFLLKDKGHLRKIIEALSSAPLGANPNSQQYQLAMILGLEEIDEKDLYTNAPWALAPSRPRVLGVVNLLPQKELLAETIEQASHTKGDTPHPVFDRSGIVRWPVNKDVFGFQK